MNQYVSINDAGICDIFAGAKEVTRDMFKGHYDHLSVVRISNTVTKIGKSAFKGCISLEFVELPDSITEIGEEAFYGCEKLTSEDIEIPNSVTTIGEKAFSGCKGLKSIAIPESVTKIEAGAFECCDSLVSIVVAKGNKYYKSDGNCCLSKDGKKLIFGCNQSIIPDNVTEIGDWAFSGCKGLTSIKIPASVKIIGEGAFSECCGLTSVAIPNGVNKIGFAAFDECTGLKAIEIPDSVTTIEAGAFADCDALVSINVANGNANYMSNGNCCLSKDGSKLIFGCKTSAIPNTVTVIGDYSFYGIYRQSSIALVIPNKVAKIGVSSFADCSKLTSIEIPDCVAEIREGAFKGCKALASITVSKGNANYKSVDNCCLSIDGKRLIFGCKKSIIPDGVTEIEKRAFEGSEELTSIEIPDSVTKIGNKAFSNCQELSSIIINTREKSPKSAQTALTFQNRFSKHNGRIKITLKVPIGCGYAYRHHPDFERKFEEILAVLD